LLKLLLQNPVDRLGLKPVAGQQYQGRGQGNSPGREQGVKNQVSKLSWEGNRN